MEAAKESSSSHDGAVLLEPSIPMPPTFQQQAKNALDIIDQAVEILDKNGADAAEKEVSFKKENNAFGNKANFMEDGTNTQSSVANITSTQKDALDENAGLSEDEIDGSEYSWEEEGGQL